MAYIVILTAAFSLDAGFQLIFQHKHLMKDTNMKELKKQSLTVIFIQTERRNNYHPKTNYLIIFFLKEIKKNNSVIQLN